MAETVWLRNIFIKLSYKTLNPYSRDLLGKKRLVREQKSWLKIDFSMKSTQSNNYTNYLDKENNIKKIYTLKT